MSPVELAHLESRLHGLGKYHMLCREHARARGLMEWQVKPKAHYVQHIYDESRLISSRWLQCYAEESNIGVIKKVWKSAANGPYHKTIQRVVCIKVLVAMCVRFRL